MDAYVVARTDLAVWIELANWIVPKTANLNTVLLRRFLKKKITYRYPGIPRLGVGEIEPHSVDEVLEVNLNIDKHVQRSNGSILTTWTNEINQRSKATATLNTWMGTRHE